MKQWKFSELKELCRAKGIPDASLYCTSLDLRWKRACYHAEAAERIILGLFKGNVNFPSEKSRKALFSYEAQVESCAQSIHALADILAQVLNIIILQSSLKEHDVSIKRVLNKMEKEKIAQDVITHIKAMLNHEPFQYIEAFCNTIKHKRLLKTNFRAEYGDSSRNEMGLSFEEFSYNGNIYQKTWGSDILNYRIQVFEQITNIGVCINTYVSKL